MRRKMYGTVQVGWIDWLVDLDLNSTSERSWLHKVQVHPTNSTLMESGQHDYDASHLFNATNSLKPPKTSSSLEHLQNKSSVLAIFSSTTQSFFTFWECSPSLFDIRPTSNVIRVNNTHQFPVCPPTPCMIGYRQRSLPTLVPTRTIKYPKTFDNPLKQSDIDYLDS